MEKEPEMEIWSEWRRKWGSETVGKLSRRIRTPGSRSRLYSNSLRDFGQVVPLSGPGSVHLKNMM